MTAPGGLWARLSRGVRALAGSDRPAAAPARRPASRRPSRPPAPAGPSADREALLAEAMRIHRSKRAMLQDLNDEDRILLEVMAHHLLVESGTSAPPPGSERTGPTPDPAPRRPGDDGTRPEPPSGAERRTRR